MINDNHSMSGHTDGSGAVVINGVRFTPKALIHQGSDSRIYSVHSSEGGADSAFVMKCYSCSKDGEIWHKAMREIEAGNMLRGCPYIVRLHGYCVLAEGEEYRICLLFDRWECAEKRNVSQWDAEKMCRDICCALDALRRKSLVHGDVKPSNIFRGVDKWLLGDLGSVCLSGECPEYCTEGYCSPEAMRGESCDIRSDIYSLGITLYQFLSGGRLPFCDIPCEEMEDDEVYAAIQKRINGEIFEPPDAVSADFAEILMRMYAYNRQKRTAVPMKIARTVDRLMKNRNI